MKEPPRVRLTQFLTESRILVRQFRLPLVRILLSMAETIVESGAVRDPLEYYKELANEASPWIALPRVDAGPMLKIHQMCSREVRKLSAAVALCPEGVRSDRGETVHIALLVSSSVRSVHSVPRLLAEVARLLQSKAHRESFLSSKSPAEARLLLTQLEQAADPLPHWNPS